MNIFLNGYYGYANAGDEAVLAAILEHLNQAIPASTCTITSGDPPQTQSMHDAPNQRIRAIGRQTPRELVRHIRACDLFVSGGGSLLQDVTSLRNMIYYTGLMRLARLSRKPVMMYAQGIGPLNKPLSQKLARISAQSAKIVTVRDQSSRQLLQKIGVKREIIVTADPVWALSQNQETERQSPSNQRAWTISLRSWTHSGGENDADFGAALFEVAKKRDVQLRFLPMQPQHDGPLIADYLCRYSQNSHILDVKVLHPRQVVEMSSRGQVMIAMRLHALIFAASRGVPCVAINYDPKVQALAEIIGAPCLSDLRDADALEQAIDAARAPDASHLQVLALAAKQNARLAAQIVGV